MSKGFASLLIIILMVLAAVIKNSSFSNVSVIGMLIIFIVYEITAKPSDKFN
jgi:drug/metabolite transporter (DMT)-like permease